MNASRHERIERAEKQRAEAETAAAPKKRGMGGIWALLSLLLVAGFLVGLYFLTIVHSITVKGNSRFSSEEVVNLSGLYTGKNIMLYDLDSAKRAVEKNPYIRCKAIHRVFRDELNIEIEERREYAAILLSGDTYCVIDETGFVLDVGRRGDITGLIPVYGLSSMGFSVGTYVNGDKSKLRPYTLIEILTAIGDKADKISYIDISNSSSVKIGAAGGVTVMLGDSVNMADKVGRMFAMLERLDPTKLDGTRMSYGEWLKKPSNILNVPGQTLKLELKRMV